MSTTNFSAADRRADVIDPSRAPAGAARWRRALSDALGQDPGAALDEPRRMLAMLKVFGSTRRLSDLALKHPIYAARALTEGASPILAEAARDLTALSAGVGGADALYGALASIKNRADLSIAIAELAGEWTSAQATAARTDLAERIVETALAWLVRGAINRGEIKIAADEAAASGVFALAGGDFAHEDLSLYGPLDVAVVYYGPSFEGQAGRLAERAFHRIGAELKEALEGRSGDYPLYAVRTPFGAGVGGAGLVEPRARVEAAIADPNNGAARRWIATSRVVAGDRQAGGEFLEAVEAKIWAGDLLGVEARADLLKPSDDPRAAFRAAANLLRWSLGAARPMFRTASAREVFTLGAGSRVLAPDCAARLEAGADLAQSLVARTQMMKGAAAFGASSGDEEIALAALCGYADPKGLAAARDGAVADARNTVLRLLDGAKAEFERYQAVDRGADDVDKLEDLGFRGGANLASIVDGWVELCATGAGARFSAIAPGLLTAFGETQRPDEAIRAFDRLLHVDDEGADRLRAACGEPRTREAIIDSLGSFGAAVEPLLASPDTIGAFFEKRGSETPRSGEEWLARYAPPPAKGSRRALALWRKEQIARIALSAAGGDLSFDAAASALEAVHRAALRWMFDAARREVDHKAAAALHVFDGAGRGLPGAPTPLGVIGTGAAPDQREEIAQRFLDSLKELGEGVFALTPDMSHRPGGVAGPLAPDIAAMKSYIQSEAVAHDHILLARARPIAGSDDAQAAAATALRCAVSNPKRADVLLRDLDRARAQRLRRDRAGSPWDIEHSEGGLLDVDLIISTLIYRHAAAQPALQTGGADAALDHMARAGIVSPDVADTLKSARAFWTRLQTARALARWSDPQREPVRRRFGALLARAAEVDSFAQVRPLMLGYAEEVTRLYAQLVLGRPSLSLVVNG